MSQRQDFEATRDRMNQRLTRLDNRVIKRFFSVDAQTYEAGTLDTPTKELIGLTASLVLRCDDCIRYHLNRVHDLGLQAEAIHEALSVGLVVGGSIVIPHLRRAVDYLDELERGPGTAPPA